MKPNWPLWFNGDLSGPLHLQCLIILFCHFANLRSAINKCKALFSVLISILVHFMNLYMMTPHCRNFIKNNWEERCSRNVTRNRQPFQYREYMPSIWQVKVLLLLHHMHIYMCRPKNGIRQGLKVDVF